jgi:hypothetical protein
MLNIYINFTSVPLDSVRLKVDIKNKFKPCILFKRILENGVMAVENRLRQKYSKSET